MVVLNWAACVQSKRGPSHSAVKLRASILASINCCQYFYSSADVFLEVYSCRVVLVPPPNHCKESLIFGVLCGVCHSLPGKVSANAIARPGYDRTPWVYVRFAHDLFQSKLLSFVIRTDSDLDADTHAPQHHVFTPAAQQ